MNLMHTSLKLFIFSFLVGCSITKTMEIDDISNLNATTISRIEYPTSLQNLVEIVNTAKKEGLKISLAGKRHSQGGHTFYKGNVVIDMNKFSKIIR